MSKPSPWWDKQRYADRRPFLTARRAITRAARHFFEEAGFVEVETACLQRSPGNETHLAAFATRFVAPGAEDVTLYLHTSPEFACKKLLAAGETRLFTLAHAFRNGERSALHHPEFTMLEWYRADAPWPALAADCAGLVAAAATAAGTDRLCFHDKVADPFAPFERLSVCEAFARHAGIDLAASLDGAGNDRDRLAAAAAGAGLRVAPDDSWSDLFSKLLSAKVEPHLGQGRLTLLHAYPASEAALARLDPQDRRFAQRFELYACGVELANGFAELTEAVEQRRRFEASMALRARLYGDAYPLDEDFLAALAVMPEASGIALGFDRLVMLAAGAPRIEQVLWTPVDDGTAT